MSDDEVIRFEITDYDLDNEFNPQRNRRAKKEQQIYGVWAKDSDEEDNEDNIRQRTRKPKDFSAPIAFVGGGVQQAGKKKEEKKDIEPVEASTSKVAFKDSSDEDAPEPEERDTAGIRRHGGGMRSVNLGGSMGTWEKHTKGIGAKLLLQMGYQPGKGLGKDLQGISAPVEATLRKGRGAIGAYGPEKSTQKAKKDEERRQKEKEEEKGPTEKSYNWKKSHKGRYFYRDASDVIQEGKPSMHTVSSSELSRVPVIDMTGKETRVLSGYHALRAAAPRFEHEPRRKCTNFAMPELMHNLEIMVEGCEQVPKKPEHSKPKRDLAPWMTEEVRILTKRRNNAKSKMLKNPTAFNYFNYKELRKNCSNASRKARSDYLDKVQKEREQDIIQNARELQSSEDEIVVLERDIDECDKKLEERDEVIDKLDAIMDRVEKLTKPDISLETSHDVLLDLKECYPQEYEAYGLGTMAGNIVSPLLSALLAKWDPLQSPGEPIPIFLKWKKLMTTDAYNSLLWQHYVPHISAAAEKWNPRIPEPMLAALTTWSEASACSSWISSLCASRHVVPRLLGAVKGWDPTGDTQPLHQWVLPWHQLAGEALASAVYPLIRLRLSAALTAWHPADGSARPLLAAWQGAWGSALTATLHEHIVPKLEHCLQHALIDLIGGENTAWVWCLDWLELLGAPTVAAIAGRALLPRWLAALAAWLNTNPTHATVINSYTNFKKMFPEEVLKEPAVKDAFRKALDMMNRSTDIDSVEPPLPPKFIITDTKETSRIADVLSSIQQTKSFSELLESKCTERGITYVPIAGKVREGRPIYRIGNMQCYVVRNVIMYSDDGRNFSPIALDRLLNIVED